MHAAAMLVGNLRGCDPLDQVSGVRTEQAQVKQRIALANPVSEGGSVPVSADV